MAYDGSPDAWSETDSQQFVEMGRIYTVARDEIRDTMLGLLPADPGDPFLAVELGVGDGWLSEAILERFPAARVLGLDGSPTMLRHTDTRLRRFAGRYELRPFRLEESGWRAKCGPDVRCFVSSLLIHHLDAAGKQALYRDLYTRLAGGGALLINDLVAPGSEWERRYTAKYWDAIVRLQSEAFTGTLDAYRQFVESDWNWYEHPDPLDMPSTLAEHLRWLDESGFQGAGVFWQRAGHAVYGGYKAAVSLQAPLP